MMSEKYGVLFNEDAKLHRFYFDEMCRLLGVKAFYQAPLKDKTYNTQSEIVSNYMEKEEVWVIFQETPNQQTLRKLNWASELQEAASIIHVPYDLHDLQQGALFYIPGGIDNSSYRLFRVVKMTNIAIYPASIALEVVPEYENTLPSSATSDFTRDSFTLLNNQEEECTF